MVSQKNKQLGSRKILASGLPSSHEGLNARDKPSDGEPSVVKHQAGRNGRDVMSRYPFLTCATKYLAVRGKTYSEATLKEVRRRYRRMDSDLEQLVRSGRPTAASPEKMNAEDVLAYIGLQKDRKLKETAISHNITVLNSLLLYAGNSAVQQCKMKYPSAMPKKRTARMESMSERDFHRIIAEANSVKETDWTRMKGYAIVLLSLCAGLRCKEVRLSRVTDLDPYNWVMRVEHPKGEGSYGEPRKAIVMPEAREFLTKYLRARNARVAKRCPRNLALIPAMRDQEDGHFSTNGIEIMKRLIEKDTSIDFDLRMCRRTFGQRLIDQGVSLDSVSVMMGHETTKTTETFYCRKGQEQAIREASMLLTGIKGYPDAKNPKIESRFEVTGYV